MPRQPRPDQPVQPYIVQVRNQRAMIDADLARLYGVPTKVLLQAVRRNAERFPLDFMFQLTEQEVAILRSQVVTARSIGVQGWGGRRSMPYAFSEQGVAMLSSVLRSARAIAVNIAIMRAFVRLRQLAGSGSELAKKLDQLESRVSGHDRDIAAIVRAIRDIATPPAPKPKRPIGFVSSP